MSRPSDLTDEEYKKYKVNAHNFLMETSGYLGIVYREQVKRVRELKRQLNELEKENRG